MKQSNLPRTRFLTGTMLALLLSFASSVNYATPPPNAVAEGFAAASVQPTKAALENKAGPENKVDPESKTDAQILEELLAESPTDEVYGSGETCISRHQVRRIEIVSSGMLLVHGNKGRRWVNQFRHRCPGLRKNQALVIETRGSRYCSLDTVYGRDRGFGGSSFGSARCHFAQFHPISVEQAQIIKAAAKNGAFRRR